MMPVLGPLPSIRMDEPAYLALLATLPILCVWSIRSIAGLGLARASTALVLRAGAVALFVLALAGLHTVRTTDDQTVVFVMDRSESVPPAAQQRAVEFLRAATKTMRPGKDRLAIVTFGGSAEAAQLPAPQLLLDRLAPTARPDQSNLGAALRLASALLPPDAARRLVLLSDGNENAGDATAESEALRSANIPLDAVPLSYRHDREVVFERLWTPSSARGDDTINLQFTLRSTHAARGRIRVFHNDQPLQLDGGRDGAFDVSLAPGSNRLSLPVPLQAAGVHRFRAEFLPDDAGDDEIAANNEARSFTVVAGREHVLAIAGEGSGPRSDEPRSLDLITAALQRDGIEVTRATASEAPADATALLAYSCVLLNNVAAPELGERRLAALASYVRDLGGGLVVIGGDQSFSVGGYARTPLEEILPVETDRARLQLLSLSMVIVLDRSGSMSGDKMSLARQGAVGAVQLLSRLDRVGVIAFDSMSEWIVPLDFCVDRQKIQARINQIGDRGGTDMYPALHDAFVTLQGSRTNLRHIVLLSDGVSEPGDFDGLADRMASAGITLSTIAVGADADHALLRKLAEKTGGRAYSADGAGAVPQIFVRETIQATRSGIHEQPFTPALASGVLSDVVAGLRGDTLPPLGGHVVSIAKAGAQAPIVRPTKDGADPILAVWQPGLGRTAAFTSGMWTGWGGDWAQWSGFSKFWSQTVRWASRPVASTAYAMNISVDGDLATVTVEAHEEHGAISGATSVDAQVIHPSFEQSGLTLRRTAPHRFSGSFPLRERGSYIARAAVRTAAGATEIVHAGISQSYPAELRELRSNDVRLTELGRRTGGRTMRLEQADSVFEASAIRPVLSRRPLWESLVLAGLLLFLADVAVRRVAISLLAMVRSWLGGASVPPGSRAPEVLAALRGTREQLRKRDAATAGPTAGASPAAAVENFLSRTRSRRPMDPQILSEHGHADKATGQPAEVRPEVPEPGADPTSRLLEAKRRLRRPPPSSG